MEPITIENAAEWLKDIIKMQKVGPVSIEMIQDIVASHFGFDVEDLKSSKRTADLALARQVAMYLARELTESSLQQIGMAFNKKDHTTVLHACRKIEEMLKEDVKMRKIVDKLADNIQSSRE